MPPTPKKMVVANTSFVATVKDKEYSVRQGESLPATHPLVKGLPAFFSEHDPHGPKAAA